MKVFNILFSILYRFTWFLIFPLVVFYFLVRSLKEPGYANGFSERLVLYKNNFPKAIWFHAVSLGEFRAARPILKKLLEKNEKILITTLTLPGKNAAEKEFQNEINSKKVAVFYNPLEFDFLFSRFIKMHRPKFCVILECDLWPVMISSIKRANIPLIFAQAQYPLRGFNRDKKYPFIKGILIQKFDLILAKSRTHIERFKFFNAKKTLVMGDTRFEQAIPPYQKKMAGLFKKKYLSNFYTVCLASIGKKEDKLIVEILNKVFKERPEGTKKKFFFVFVPRHPSDFDKCEELFDSTPIKIQKRSVLFQKNLILKKQIIDQSFHKGLQAVWGDSLGEMYFYLELADLVFMGDSFNDEGSHNIIEPFALGKPVLVGPSIWGIEYPAVEAINAGILKQVHNQKDLYDEILSFSKESSDKKKLNKVVKAISIFYKNHSGATLRFYNSLIQAGLIDKTTKLKTDSYKNH